MTDALPSLTHAALDVAVSAAARRWIDARRQRIVPFTHRHFGWRGAWQLNRVAFGRDLLRAPLNVLWAGPRLAIGGVAALSRRGGLRRAAERLERVPHGWRTDVERELEWLIFSDWLELPFTSGVRRCEHDSLFEAVLAEPVVAAQFAPVLAELAAAGQHLALRGRLTDFLAHYTASRVAAAELSNALVTLAAGAALNQFTPGTVAIGAAAASGIAQHLAVAQFALGPTLGSLYYAAFPATASTGLLVASTGGAMAALGVLAAISGVLTDPLQQALGLHARRLHKLLDALNRELDGQGSGGFALHDAYVARVFDLLDLLNAAVRALR